MQVVARLVHDVHADGVIGARRILRAPVEGEGERLIGANRRARQVEAEEHELIVEVDVERHIHAGDG